MKTPGMQGEVSQEATGKTRVQPSKARPTRNRHFRNYLGTLRNRVG
jgi:hypothetical protein